MAWEVRIQGKLHTVSLRFTEDIYEGLGNKYWEYR